MNSQLPIAQAAILQRARGQLDIRVQRRPGDVTRLHTLRQQGSFRAIFPRPIHGNIEAVMINTAGGVTGGDRFSTKIHAHEDAHISVTTQAAERIYRATGDAHGVVGTEIHAEKSAQIFWMPQETILFDGARLRRSLKVELHATARFLMVEPLIFGRDASGETLRSGLIDDRVSITTGGTPIYLDRIRLTGNISTHLDRPAIANGARAIANIVLVDQDAHALLPAIRALLPETAGASLLSDTVLIVRLLAENSFALRTSLFPILTRLTHDAVPKNWRL